MTDRDNITLPREVVFRAVKALTPMAYDTWPRERQEIVTALRTALAAEQPAPTVKESLTVRSRKRTQKKRLQDDGWKKARGICS